MLVHNEARTLNSGNTPIRQLDFAAGSSAAAVMAELRRMFGLESDELSSMRLEYLMKQARRKVAGERLQAEFCEEARGRTSRPGLVPTSASFLPGGDSGGETPVPIPRMEARLRHVHCMRAHVPGNTRSHSEHGS